MLTECALNGDKRYPVLNTLNQVEDKNIRTQIQGFDDPKIGKKCTAEKKINIFVIKNCNLHIPP
jgi:hypothetical protein